MSTPQELTAAPVLVYQQIPKQVSRKDFNRYIAPSLKRPIKGPPPKLSLYKIFNYILYVLHTGLQWNQLKPTRDDIVIVLPKDPDVSAKNMRIAIQERRNISIGIVITDTFGRPWRDGLAEFALGVSGFEGLLDLRGGEDLQGRELHHTVISVADELSCAAGLLMEKSAAIPAVIIRGYKYIPAEGSGKVLIRPAEADLFR